ncbi:MAG TPA: VWA domain-containing protein [Blastocatellia bacterium]|nr:VWA domain-containing protein [Blastocatellia bacterium]
MKSGPTGVVVLLTFSLLWPPISRSQDRPSQRTTEQRGDVIELTGTLINVPVVVRDSNNRYIANLKKEHFRLFEDGIEQEIAFFSNTEEPFNVALLLDTSGSTREELPRIQDAAITFVEQLHDYDRVMVISFDDDIDLQCELTSDRREIVRAIRRVRSGGSTRLYDAVAYTVEQHLNHLSGRKAIVLFTDGVDTASQNATFDGTIRDLEESNVLVYSIRYNTLEAVARRMGGSGGVIIGRIPVPLPFPRAPQRTRWPIPWPNTGPFPVPGRWPSPTPSPRRGPGSPTNGRLEEMYRRGEAYLSELADRTGGALYAADTLYDLPGVFEQIADELRHQYMLGYYPSNTARDGSYRRIRVTVRHPDAHVRARPGYRAPSKQ